MKVIGYGRVSTEEQESNYSLDGQRSRYEFLCKQNGWQSMGFFPETSSGTSIKGRPVLQHVLQLIRQGEVDTLWVRETDRLTRPEDLGDISTIAGILESTDTLLIVDTQEYNLKEDSSVLMLDFQGVFAKYFRRQLLRNTQRGKVRKAESGRKAGGRDVFGYVTDEKGCYQPHPEQARTVKLIFNLAMNGLTAREIAEELEAKAIPTATGNRKWSYGVVSHILRNDIYIGIYRYQKSKRGKDRDRSRYKLAHDEEVVVGSREEPNHPPIVEAWVFEAVQQKLDANKKDKSKKLHMATGLLRCAVCGDRMSVKYSSAPRKSKVEKYVCNQKPACVSDRLPVADVNEVLWGRLVSLFTKPERVHSLVLTSGEGQKESLESRLVATEREEKSISDKQNKLLDLYLEGNVTKPAYQTKTEQFDDRLAALRREREETQDKLEGLNQADLSTQLIHTLRILSRSQKRFTPDQKTQVFRSMVKEAHLRENETELELYVEPIQNFWWKYQQKEGKHALEPLPSQLEKPRVVGDLLKRPAMAKTSPSPERLSPSFMAAAVCELTQ